MCQKALEKVRNMESGTVLTCYNCPKTGSGNKSIFWQHPYIVSNGGIVYLYLSEIKLWLNSSLYGITYILDQENKVIVKLDYKIGYLQLSKEELINKIKTLVLLS